MSFFDTRYSETDWRRDSDIEDVARLAQEERDLAEWTMESTPRETAGELRSAGEYVSTLGWCDGSGYFEEQIDVDQTRGILCGGCPACEEEQKTWAPIEEHVPAPVIPLPVAPVERKPIYPPYYPAERVARIGNGLYVAVGSGKRRRRA